jgi:hypothetical protein
VLESKLEAPQLLSLPPLLALAVLILAFACPVLHLRLDLWVDPRVVQGTLGISLRQAHGLHGLILTVSVAALDGTLPRLEVFIVVEDEPAIMVPGWDPGVHAVVPGLQALDSAFRGLAEQGGELLLDSLPLHLLVMPGIDDEVTFFHCVLLVDVAVTAVQTGLGETI